MDTELRRMQEQANRICNVRLRRIKPYNPPFQPRRCSENDDSVLLLALLLILAMDGGDKTLMLMLFYIFAA